MSESETDGPAEAIGIATRTLVAAGYAITNSRRHRRHIEIECTRALAIGAQVPLLLAISHETHFSDEERDAIVVAAGRMGRAVAFVAREPGDDCLGFTEFLDALGGPVPSWRALTADFGTYLVSASRNELPEGLKGEAWLLFEDLVADGLEFVFGRKARRLGGRTRGKPVSDILASTPEPKLLLVDAKAAASGFDAALANLRDLGSYVRRQQARQRGIDPVYGAAVFSSAFSQNAATLQTTSASFFGDYGVPVTFVTADVLSSIVLLVRDSAPLRNSIRWSHLFSGGLLTLSRVEQERRDATQERHPSKAG